MINLQDIKLKIEGHKSSYTNWMFISSPRVAYDFMVICEQLVEEVESLRKDLAEMYEVTKGKNHVYKTK